MPKCIMCGKNFSKSRVEDYIDSKFGFSEYERIESSVGEVCDSCAMGIYYAENGDDDELNSDKISVYEAAEIWASSGKDEDQMFGYTTEELEEALN